MDVTEQDASLVAPLLISVVIPAYNRQATIGRAVDSIRSQTHVHLEVIVVDDGSSDETFAVASRISEAEPRLRVIRLRTNVGAQAARNVGIANANGAWIAFLDSDDAYLPESLERRLKAAIGEGCSAVHAECVVLRPDGTSQELLTAPMKGDIRREVLARPGPTFPGLMVEKRCLDAIGGLDESVVAFQEWDTAIRLALVTRFAFVSEPMFLWDQRRTDTISRDLRRSVRGYEQVVRKHLRSILRHGGPRLLASHLFESGRQHRVAGDHVRAATRYAAAVVVWPPGLRHLASAFLRRTVPPRGARGRTER